MNRKGVVALRRLILESGTEPLAGEWTNEGSDIGILTPQYYRVEHNNHDFSANHTLNHRGRTLRGCDE